jgi:hypothetical protein
MNKKKISLADIHWIDLDSNKDNRGTLTSIESGKCIPFEIKRVFYMHHIGGDRGGHSHLETDQVIIAISGNFKVDIHDGKKQKTYNMNDCSKGLYVPRRLFTSLYEFNTSDVCLVLASTHYERSKSQRTWDEFIKMKNEVENA